MVGIAERGSARATSRRIFARSPIKNSISIKKEAMRFFTVSEIRGDTPRREARADRAELVQFYTGDLAIVCSTSLPRGEPTYPKLPL